MKENPRTVIQINSLPALERLIGNNPEIEIEIRNAVVQKYANKHLKVLRDLVEESLRKTRITIEKGLQEKINEEFDGLIHSRDRWGNLKKEFNANSLKAIREEADNEFSRMVRKEVVGQITKALDGLDLAKSVEVSAIAEAQKLGRDQVRREIRAKIDKG